MANKSVNHTIQKLINILDISHIGFNLDFSPYAQKRDADILKLCNDNNISAIVSDSDGLLLSTEQMLNDNGQAFRVYGSFYKHVIKHQINKPKKLPRISFYNKSIKGSYPITFLTKLYEFNPYLDQNGGLTECMKRIKAIKYQKNYNTMRDRLDYETTHLSAYISMGIVSCRQIYHILKSKLGNKTDLLKQMYWQSFYLVSYRFIENANSFTHYIDSRFDKIKWRTYSEYKKDFTALWESKTGLLVIDAAMKQLRTTGFMHGRARMICVIYACKYLMINMLDPKWGSHAWYSRSLVDCAGANNKMNNNWAMDFDLTGRRFGAGISGRPMDVSNEKTISKFDPEANYIKKWLPHLKDVPVKDLKHWNKDIADTYDNIHPYFTGDLKQMYLRWRHHTK